MIPVLYEKDETAFISNGLGRLRDCIGCTVTEERNGIYECDFEYPVNGAHFESIQCGRIIGVTHDDTGDVQPFDIVSYEKPLNGVVTFHCVHISYRQSRLVVSGTNINSLADAFTMLSTATPANPFTYDTDKTSTGYMAAADGVPKTVRQMLGGVEGSILDAYGGEYEWNRFNVKLWSRRGTMRPFVIRYGVNLIDYNDATDYQETFTSCIPYWVGSDQTVVGNKVDSGAGSFNGRDMCIPLDLSTKFETAPTTADLESAAASYMTENASNLPAQTINVSFLHLADSREYASFAPLLQCSLCDTVNVAFPRYGMTGTFKIVKTVWNVLTGRYDEMELGTLSTTLADALGISNNGGTMVEGGGSSEQYTIGTDAVNIAALNAGSDTQGSKALTSKDLAIVGYNLTGTRATFVSINRLYIENGTVYYQMRNFGTNATSALILNIYTLQRV